MYTCADGNVYFGEFRNNSLNGWGTLFVMKEGDRYEGAFKNFSFLGVGALSFGYGNTFEGEWADGCKSYGVFTSGGKDQRLSTYDSEGKPNQVTYDASAISVYLRRI